MLSVEVEFSGRFNRNDFSGRYPVGSLPKLSGKLTVS